MIKKVQLKNLFLILLSFALIIFPIIIISANLTETQQIIARDSKRISDISTLYSKIEKYKTEYGNYPKIDSSDSSYKINGFVSSTMSEDWNKFSSSLGLSNIVDPINKNVRNIKVIASPYEPDIVSTTCSISPFDTGIYIDGLKIYGYTRGYMISNFDPNWNHIETKAYDTYGSSQEAINMRDYIATIPQENYIVIYTYDEPRQNIDIIWNTLLNLGASNELLDKIGNNPDCGYRSAYILVGKRNLYQNNAFYESWGPRGAGSCMGCPISHEFSVDSLNKSLYGDYGYTWTKGSSAYHYIYCPKDTYLEDDNCYITGASQEEDSFYLELDLEDASRIEDWGLQDNPHIIYSKGDINSRIYSNNDSVCGNYVLEGREECEIGSSPKIEACVSGLESGYKVFNCDFNTCLYEEEDLENPKECLLGGIYCGDGVIQSENGEECEGGYEELCVKNFGDHDWYNNIIRYCDNSCKWNISDSVNLSDCIGYCGDMVVQEEYGEDCDDETSNCVGCKYINKSPTIEGIITSSVREDYEGDVITRETYETSGIFKDSKYFILKADASDKVSGYTYYKWKISRASNYEIDIRNSFTDITVESIDSIMKTDGSFETEYTEGLDSIRIYPTGSNLNPSGDEIFDHNYTGVYNVILYMKNRYTDTETGQFMDSREVSFLFDFAIGSVCGDHIVQTPNSQGKNEYCEWKKGYYRIPEIENGTAIYNTSVYGGGSGTSSSDQYYCDIDCNDSGGFCMDGFLQVEFEKCDPSSVSSTFNVFGTGLNIDESYGCDTSCQVSSNYCGDGYLTRDYEVCDPTYKVLSSESSSSLQYLCDNGIPNNNNMTPWVLSKDPDEEDDGLSGLDYVKNTLPSATCTYNRGGYCGDGIVQHYYETGLEDGKTIYTGTYNTRNPGITGDDPIYSGKTGPENLMIEECDPLNFTIPGDLKNTNSTYTYSCTSDCKLKKEPIHPTISLIGGYCGDNYVQTNKTLEGGIFRITSIDQAVYETKLSSERASYNLEKCDPDGFRTPNKNAHKDTLNQYSCTSSCTFSGGYCGDGIIQYQWKKIDGIFQTTPESQTSYTGLNDVSSGWTQLEICDPLNYHKPTPAESKSNWQYQCTGDCGFIGGYCGDGILQTSHGEKCDPNQEVFVNNLAGDISPTTYEGTSVGKQCKDDCSGCKTGYVLEGGKCIPPDMGYIAHPNGVSPAISCNTTKDDNLLTIEQYDSRADNDPITFSEFLAPNTSCPNCVYTPWSTEICIYTNQWQKTRSATNLSSSIYCLETQDIYGSCSYCSNPSGGCGGLCEETKCACGIGACSWICGSSWSTGGWFSCGACCSCWKYVPCSTCDSKYNCP